jgi:NitT/TauT family transport system substrate-binding protein
MKDVRYAGGRTYDAEDTLRFYALRLHELGMIIAPRSDWRSLNEWKKELKG